MKIFDGIYLRKDDEGLGYFIEARDEDLNEYWSEIYTDEPTAISNIGDFIQHLIKEYFTE